MCYFPHSLDIPWTGKPSNCVNSFCPLTRHIIQNMLHHFDRKLTCDLIENPLIIRVPLD